MTDDELINILCLDPASCVHCYRWSVDCQGRMWCPVRAQRLVDLYAQGIYTCWYWLQPPVMSLEYEYWQQCQREVANG